MGARQQAATDLCIDGTRRKKAIKICEDGRSFSPCNGNSPRAAGTNNKKRLGVVAAQQLRPLAKTLRGFILAGVFYMTTGL
jgi:hypothetical protein